MSAIEIVPLEYATFRFPDPDLADRVGVVVGHAVRHRDGVFLFDTGFGFGNDELDARYQPVARRIDEVLTEAGIEIGEITALANCHLHADHAGQNAAFPDVPILVQRTEWEIAHTTDHTILEWIDFPGARYVRLEGVHEVVPGMRLVPTPGHTPGHQSVVVDAPGGSIVLAGQACYTVGEWTGDHDTLEGRSSAPDRTAYDDSLARLRDGRPSRVHFSHDRATWVRQNA